MQQINIIWFRNNLRVQDNEALSLALKKDTPILPVFCFEPEYYKPTQYGFKKTEAFRAQFLIETVEDLQQQLEGLGLNLYISTASAKDTFQELASQYQINQIYTQKEWTSEEQQVQQSISTLLPQTKWIETYDQFLFHPEDIPFDIHQIPKVFSVFRKKCERYCDVRGEYVISNKTVNGISLNSTLPKLEDLGFKPIKKHPHTAFPFKGGSTAGQKRVKHYLWDSNRIAFYKKTRNGLLGLDYSSKFSAWLANGSLSVRQIYQEILDYEEQVEQNESTYWLIFELIWREFFKYVSLKHGNSIFHLEGITQRIYDWKTDIHSFQKWANGETQEPFVNANMQELQKTGWMSNRGRQNVASYFSKNMKMDWRIGAAYFEAMLIDYDVHSNYGNWMYVAGVGNDPRDRTFNVQLQASRYDKQGKFQKLWLSPTLF